MVLIYVYKAIYTAPEGKVFREMHLCTVVKATLEALGL